MDLLTSYSNSFPQVRALCSALEHRVRDQSDHPDLRNQGARKPWALRRRLTLQDLEDIASKFATGARQGDIAQAYGISLSSVKRLLRASRPA